MAEENASEDIPFSVAQELYDKNVAKIMEKVTANKRGMFRVLVDNSGLIMEVTKTRMAKPQPSTFTLFVPGNDQRPKFGSFTGLRDHQLTVIKILERDIEKILETNEMAYILQSSAEESGSKVMVQAGQQVEELKKRFGSLPEPLLKRQVEAAKSEKVEQEKVEEERRQVWEEIGDISFEDVLREEYELEKKLGSNAGRSFSSSFSFSSPFPATSGGEGQHDGSFAGGGTTMGTKSSTSNAGQKKKKKKKKKK